MPSAPLVRRLSIRVPAVGSRVRASRRSDFSDRPTPDSRLPARLHAPVVRRRLRAEEPLRARLHPDRGDGIDHHAGRRSHPLDEELSGEPGFFVCHVRGEDRAGLRCAADGGADRVQRFAPRRDAEVVVIVADLRHDHAIGVVALVGEAAEVAQPVIVDVGIDARPVAEDLSLPEADEDIAADVAAVAHRLRGLEVPDARLEAELARGERAGGADVGDARRHPVVERRSRKHADLGGRAALEEPQLTGAADLGGEADAARAVDAAVHVLHDVRADRRAVHARIGALELAVARGHAAVVERVVLQRALAGLVADRAVQRMVDEEELHLPFARRIDFLVPDVDLHPLFDRRRATGLQFPHPFDLDEAHAALADDAEGGVVAEVGNVDVGGLAASMQLIPSCTSTSTPSMVIFAIRALGGAPKECRNQRRGAGRL